MVYPKQYGGGENIDYFAIMETLSYHDLSLVLRCTIRALGNEHTITWNRKTL
jgi:hypothetical protein